MEQLMRCLHYVASVTRCHHTAPVDFSQCWALQMFCIVIWATEKSAVCRKQLQLRGLNLIRAQYKHRSILWSPETMTTTTLSPPHSTSSILHTSPAVSCSQTPQFSFTRASQASKEYQAPSRQENRTAEVTDWNSQCEQFQSFACCFWPSGSRACCGGRVWLADVSLCSDTAEVLSGVLDSGRALIVW